MQIEVGAVLEGKVSGITNFGAFVDLPGGKSGLVHISEVASVYVNDIHQHLSEGDTVKVKVIALEKGKIGLSIKQAEDKPKKGKDERRQPHQKRQRHTEPAFDPKKPPEEFEFKKNENMSFDDMLQKFKQDSDEKFSDLKRSNDGKRSGGYKRAY